MATKKCRSVRYLGNKLSVLYCCSYGARRHVKRFQSSFSQIDRNYVLGQRHHNIAHGKRIEKYVGTRRMLMSHDCIPLFFTDTFFS